MGEEAIGSVNAVTDREIPGRRGEEIEEAGRDPIPAGPTAQIEEAEDVKDPEADHFLLEVNTLTEAVP